MILGRYLRVGSLAMTAALTVALWPAAAARATFPGGNGLITFSASVPVTSKFVSRTDQIFVIESNGKHLTRLTHSPKTDDVNPSFDASGKRIAFDRSPLPGPGKSSIWVMNANGSAQKRLVSGSLGGPSFSPDGKSIAFTRSIGSGLGQVWVMRADGTHQKRLTSTMQNSEGVYTPSGKQIVFVRDNTQGMTNIWIMNANGTGQHALTSSGTADTPSVSPDGKHIVFAQATGTQGLDGIWVMDINGQGARVIVSPGSGDLGNTHPCFSPDGKKIAFWSERNGQGQIWIANANGTRQTQLTHGSSSPLTPNWGPKPG